MTFGRPLKGFGGLGGFLVRAPNLFFYRPFEKPPKDFLDAFRGPLKGIGGPGGSR